MDDRISPEIRRRAQSNLTALLRGMAAVSQKRVAELIGVSPTTMSDIKSDQLERFAALAAACGCKMVPSTHQTHDESYISALKTLAAVGLNGVDPKSEVDE
jgi:DNA-binding XRE family transcriptional regulator